ncbi:Lhr family helicase, partial [Streptomyces europaeiscabiei]|uniref:Lhr family helicase n=1 Tax=Streptomyces europaeiscabiei TaxID=146819 RepID=UPI0029A9B43C
GEAALDALGGHGAHALARTLLDRHGVVTRGAVAAEGVEGGFSAVYRVLSVFEESGQARRGYVVEGLGAAQFAMDGAVDRLRAVSNARERNEPLPGPTPNGLAGGHGSAPASWDDFPDAPGPDGASDDAFATIDIRTPADPGSASAPVGNHGTYRAYDQDSSSAHADPYGR